MAPLAAVNADLTIAVGVSGSEVIGKREPEPGATVEWLNRMVRSTSALLDTTAVRSLLDWPTARAVLSRFGADTWSDESDEELSASADELDEAPGVPKLGSFEVVHRAFDIAQSALTRHTLSAYPPDLLIEVPRSTCRSLDFHRAAEVIAAGRALANRALDALAAEPNRAAPTAIEG
jgi:NTE family protein